MLKFTSLIVCTILTQQISLSQNWRKKVDSLENILSQKKTDRDKIELCFELHSVLIANDPKKAIHYTSEAKEIADKLQDSSLIGKALLCKCEFYHKIGDYTSSLETAYEALKIVGNDNTLLNNCHNRIATVHAELSNVRETLEHNLKALYYSSLAGDSMEIISNIHNIGVTYGTLEKYDSALYYLRLTNDFSIRKLGYPDSYALSNMGDIYCSLGKYDSALILHFEAYKYDSIFYREYLLGIDEQYIAHTYIEMEKYGPAKKFLLKSLERAKKLGASELALPNYEYLHQIYAEEGNYEKAYESVLKYSNTSDSLNEQQNELIIHGLETKYKLEEQENKLILAQRQRSLFITLTIVSILFVFSLLIIVLLAYRRHQINKVLMKELRLANDSKARLLSIISHDLRGSVGTLRTAAIAISEGMTDLDNTRTLLESFYPVADSTYDLLENLLTWTKCNSEQLKPEVTDVKLFNTVEKGIKHTQHLASNKEISIINTIHEDIDLRTDKNMLLSIVRNLITNAIKFSHPHSEITIGAMIKEAGVVTFVEDCGIGIEPEILDTLFYNPETVQTTGTKGERGTGLGIAICKSFVESLHGKIWAKSEPGKGSTFFFSLPMEPIDETQV